LLKIQELLHICINGLLLKYEDMIENFPEFNRQLTPILDLDEEIVNALEMVRLAPSAKNKYITGISKSQYGGIYLQKNR